MAFVKYISSGSGLKMFNGISINRQQIYFGTIKFPFTYVQIEYDIDKHAIRFSQGDRTNAYKIMVSTDKKRYWINAKTFINKDLLPKGRYRNIGDYIYQHENYKEK